MDYFRIIRNAYRLTIRHPWLWSFGLFLIGGFNLHFFHYIDADSSFSQMQSMALAQWNSFNRHPAHAILLACICIGMLVALLYLVSWLKVSFLLEIRSLVPFPKKDVQQITDKMDAGLFTPEVRQTNAINHRSKVKAGSYIASVMYISLITSAIVVMSGIILFSPVGVSIAVQYRKGLLFGAAIFFTVVTFIFSAVNIFATFFSVLFKTNVKASLNMANDFVAVQWKRILIFTFLLAAIYALCYFAGVSLIYMLRHIVWFVTLVLTRSGFEHHYILRFLLAAVSGMAVWILLAALTVFNNIALILFFLELIIPLQKTEESVSIAPATSTSPSSSAD